MLTTAVGDVPTSGNAFATAAGKPLFLCPEHVLLTKTPSTKAALGMPHEQAENAENVCLNL